LIITGQGKALVLLTPVAEPPLFNAKRGESAAHTLDSEIAIVFNGQRMLSLPQRARAKRTAFRRHLAYQASQFASQPGLLTLHIAAVIPK
jgi:hypothetical protein